ncbi:MAG: mucoidy inhibitor MuiA family protein [Candidatus Omnitrophica bacterium]|nr:mucoidy inhibitor MuiA family protein [Candidatus Omnitrophota bacterium]
MKERLFRFLIFNILFSLIAGNILANEIVTDSQIKEVVVYPDSALITRKASLKLKPGEYKIIFANIITELDENSLKVSVLGEAEVRLFGAQLKREYVEEIPSERIKQLKDEIQRLEDQIKNLQNTKNLLLEEKNFLDSVRLFSRDQIPKDLVTRMPTPKELDDILKFLDTKLKENYSAIMEYEFKIRDLVNKVDTLKKELSQISGPQKKIKRSIVVELEVLKPGSLDLNVSYLVKGAWWQPIYDARANFEKSEVELVYYGVVKQTTGEDWSNVEISLSTAKPAIGGRMPYVAPWFLKPLHTPAAIEDKARERVGSVYQYTAFAPLERLEGARPEVEYAEVKERGVALTYKLSRKVDIKSDGSEHKLPISSQILSAKFEYSAYPRVSNFAYLGSRVTNAKDLQLLAGRVNIFLEGDFVGLSSIDNIGAGEEFDLYLGVDENVKIKREQIEKKVDETLIAAIPSATKRAIFKYKITVENYKSKRIHVKLFEAMPVSEDERIKVKISDVSLEPNQKDWKDRKGIWLWALKLEPKAKQEIYYAFSIEHPRQMQVEGL